MPNGCRRMLFVLITSVEVMETTAGATLDAMSANDGIVTEVTVAFDDVVWIGADCAFDFRISPRSALTTMPNTTDAMTIATVDKMRFVREFIVVVCSLCGLENTSRGRTIFAAARSRHLAIVTNQMTKCFVDSTPIGANVLNSLQTKRPRFRGARTDRKGESS